MIANDKNIKHKIKTSIETSILIENFVRIQKIPSKHLLIFIKSISFVHNMKGIKSITESLKIKLSNKCTEVDT